MDDPPGPKAGPSEAALPPALAAYTDYEVVRELGRGGMGIVYLARNRLMDRLEALKLRAGSGNTDEFIREVQAAARLTHPNLVSVYSARLIFGTLVLAMEYVDGWDLARLVTHRGPLAVGDACELVRQAALGLQHAHSAGVIHRDVKPANLILSVSAGQLTVKVLDFGIARAGGDSNDLSPGTPAYAAPEQFNEPRRVDTRSDLYALGGTLHFLLTGDRPFAADSWVELLRQHREDPPPRLDAVRFGVPHELADLVERMMAKDPDARPQSAAEVAQALARHAEVSRPLIDWVTSRRAVAETLSPSPGWTPVMAGELSLAPTVNLRKSPSRAAGRRRRILAGAAAVVLVAGLCTGWAAREWPAAPEHAELPVPARPLPISLFDGRSLDGWVVDGGDPDEWRIEDGAIITTGTKRGSRSWLLSEGDYGDFRVQFEYRLEAGGNSGFVFRAVPGECPVLKGGRPTSEPYHQQVEISDDEDLRWAALPTGQVNGAGISTGPALKPHQPAPLRPSGSGTGWRSSCGVTGFGSG